MPVVGTCRKTRKDQIPKTMEYMVVYRSGNGVKRLTLDAGNFIDAVEMAVVRTDGEILAVRARKEDGNV